MRLRRRIEEAWFCCIGLLNEARTRLKVGLVIFGSLLRFRLRINEAQFCNIGLLRSGVDLKDSARINMLSYTIYIIQYSLYNLHPHS